MISIKDIYIVNDDRSVIVKAHSVEVNYFYNFKNRAKEKELSRQKDYEDIRNGIKSWQDIKKENGLFAGRNVRINFDKAILK